MSEIHSERMARFEAAGLYLVTSGERSAGRPTLAIVEAALEGGVRLIQLREKTMPIRRYYELARAVRERTGSAGALLIVNDRLDVAMAVNADGVHLGQSDLPVPVARDLAPDLVIGASTHSADEAGRAVHEGASYVNIGPLFATTTKVWQEAFLGLDGLRAIAPHVTVPFSVMGGIKREHIPGLLQAGARTIALVTAVTEADDPAAATRELLALIRGGESG